MTQQKIISSYLKQVKRNCPFSFRKKLISDLKNHLFDYLDDNPGSTLEDIKNHLGSPEKFADEYLLVMDETTRKKAIHKTKWIKYTILSGIVSIVLIIAVTAVMMLVKISQTRVHYYNEYVTEDIDQKINGGQTYEKINGTYNNGCHDDYHIFNPLYFGPC